jgi:hypothetical protein
VALVRVEVVELNVDEFYAWFAQHGVGATRKDKKINPSVSIFRGPIMVDIFLQNI